MDIRFISSDKTKNQFFATLRKRVDLHFKENKISKHYTGGMVIKTIVLLLLYIVPFIFINLADLPLGISLLCWIIMGFSLAGIGMSIMHDANHGAYSASSKANFWLGSTLNLLGGSSFNWKLQHNILHHTFTNIIHKDDDIEDKLIMRFSPHTDVKWYHKLQTVYAFFFYGILTLYWVLLKDFVQFSKYTKEGLNKNNKHENTITLLKMILVKIGYFTVFIIIPLFIIKLPVAQYICGFLLMHFIAGFMLTVIFQLAHTVEETNHPLPDETGNIDNCWAMHQMSTTVNFSTGNKFLSWYLGGLNFQVEHHLFPTICHVHYPEIATIVKQTAEEYGVPYLENKTFWLALKSHFGALKKFGRLPNINEAIS